MTIQVSPTESQQWIRTTDRKTGRQLAVLVPSASVPGKYHLVTRATCDCKGFSYRGDCRHLRAVQAEALAKQAEPGRAACAGCARTSVYHKVNCRGVKVPLLGRICA